LNILSPKAAQRQGANLDALGQKYVVETLKLLPVMPDSVFIDQVVSQMAELGRVNHAVNTT